MRRILITLVLLIAAVILAVGGFLGGIGIADERWVSDFNRLGEAITKLDHDIKAAKTVARDSEYFRNLTNLPLETFDDKSVTYYVGPFARYSATIEFDTSGTKGLSVR